MKRRAVDARSGLRIRDLLDEVISGIVQRPTRAALTALGTALGLAAFVAVLGLTSTASGQISNRFTALAATEVTLELRARTDHDEEAFPSVGMKRVRELVGVREVGVTWPVRLPADVTVSAQPAGLRENRGESLTVVAASPGYLKAVHSRTGTGVLFDEFHTERAERVVVLGKAAAHRLGVTRIDAQPAVFVGGMSFTVIGIIDSVDRQSDLLLSVIIPDRTVARIWGAAPASGSSTRLLIETALGAAAQVGRQAPVAALPANPEVIKANIPPDPRTLRDQVSTDLDALFLLLAAISLVIGAIGIANTSLVAVMERVPEIGLRRALGAGRRHIAAQFLIESATLGLIGGVVGTVVGVVSVLGVSLAKHWTPIAEPWVVYPAPLVGCAVGLLAGVYPAWRASRVEPAQALRR